MEYIQSHNSSRLLIPEETNFEKNVFTILIGKNGVGKSTLLSEICIDAQYKQNNMAAPTFSKVIAVSTSPFDKFKSTRYSKRTTRYRYIGMKGSGASSSISLISSATVGILENIANKSNNLRLKEALNILGFSPTIRLILKDKNYNSVAQKYSTIFSEIDSDPLNTDNKNSWLSLNAHKLSKEDYEFYVNAGAVDFEKLQKALIQKDKTFENRKSIKIDIDFETGIHTTNEIEMDKLLTLLKYNQVGLMDLVLKKKDIGSMSLRRASSGEQCMLVMMLGIAGHIEDESIVLIDEPEISLHPSWQEQFMPTLEQVFSGYKKCQFIIATHSPQIVSKVNKDNCFVTSLSNNKIIQASYLSNRSSDYQLAEVFEAPGTMNEYINRLAFSLLSKIKSKGSINSDDKLALEKLLNLSDAVSTDDPTYHLIFSIKEVFEHYASNQ